MLKLTETQIALLQWGITDPEGVIDLSRDKARPAAALSAVLGALRCKGLAEKTVDGRWRVTEAGRRAAGPEPEAVTAPPAAPENAAGDGPPAIRPDTKQRQILALLQQEDGAGMAAMMATTGWQAHSVRALLSGLRKVGMSIVCEKRPGVCEKRTDEPSRYRVLDECGAV